jgi:hypothetical protein
MLLSSYQPIVHQADPTMHRYERVNRLTERLRRTAEPALGHPGSQTGSGAETETGINVIEVAVHGSDTDEQLLPDLGVGEPFGHQPRHLELTRSDVFFPAIRRQGRPK